MPLTNRRQTTLGAGWPSERPVAGSPSRAAQDFDGHPKRKRLLRIRTRLAIIRPIVHMCYAGLGQASERPSSTKTYMHDWKNRVANRHRKFLMRCRGG